MELPLSDWEPSKTSNPVLAGESLATKDEIVAFIHSKSNQWIDEDDDQTFQRLLYEKFHVKSPAWQHMRKLLHSLIDEWLVYDCYGPVREILGLLDGVAVDREQREALILSGTQPVSSSQADQYHVIVQCSDVHTAHHDKEIGRPVISKPHPQGVYSSAMEANKEARRAIEAIHGPRSYAQRWNELLRDDGTVQIRAVYVDLANNAKSLAWVEKQRA